MDHSGTFSALVRHELKFKGSWRKKNNLSMTRRWSLLYAVLVAIVGLGVATYFAIHNQLRLQNLWYATMGFPYLLFFLGFGGLKREWENETYGWWLTLPYPRSWLIGAKWIAAWLQMLAIIVGIFLVGTLYAACITGFVSPYGYQDFEVFMRTGVNWIFMIIGFSPFILSLGFFTASVQSSTLRPITPILWILFMGGGSYFYSGIQEIAPGSLEFQQITAMSTWWPFTWAVLGWMVASWVLGYLIISLTAGILSKKLSL